MQREHEQELERMDAGYGDAMAYFGELSSPGFLEHYNTAAVPTRAYKPKEKDNVESGVKIVTNWIIHYLTDRTSDGFVIHLDSPPLGMVEE